MFFDNCLTKCYYVKTGGDKVATTKDATVYCRVKEIQKNQLKEAADELDVTLSGLMFKLITEFLDGRSVALNDK